MIGKWSSEWASQIQLATTYFSEINSTNLFAKENFDKLSYPHLILSDLQTNGKGRGQNTWLQASKGDALYSTWCFKINSPPAPIITAKIGLILFQSLSKTFPDKKFSVKAPNDIYLDDKKLGGILVENISMQENFLFIGIGINAISAPKNLNIATYLTDKPNKELWFLFLSTFYKQLYSLKFTQPNLTDQQRLELTTALNKYPKLEDHITDVTSTGSIIFKDKVLHWLDL